MKFFYKKYDQNCNSECNIIIFSFSLGKSEVKFGCSKRGRSFTFEAVNATPDICLKPDATFES